MGCSSCNKKKIGTQPRMPRTPKPKRSGTPTGTPKRRPQTMRTVNNLNNGVASRRKKRVLPPRPRKKLR